MANLVTKIKRIDKTRKVAKIVFDESPKSNNLIGTLVPNNLEYVGGSQTTKVEGYEVKNITENHAKKRIGLQVDRTSVTVRQKETRIGKSFGSVTLIGNDKKLADFEAGREGKDVKSIFRKTTALTPRLTVGHNIFTNEIDNTLDVTVYGQGTFYKIYDEKYKLIPFRDFPGKLNPVDLIGKTHITAYPFVTDLKINFSQFVDPSISGFDGAIDALSSRQSLIDNDIRSFTVNSLKADLMGGGVEYSQKGNLIIDDKKEIKNGTVDYFLDSQEVLFPGFNFPQTGVTGSSGKSFGIQGYSSDAFYKLSPFNDKQHRNKTNKYTILTYAQKELLLEGSDRTKSEIGERFKASNRGFIFGESNVLGTDSIAFGGLKK